VRFDHELTDPVHGLVLLTALERRLIDTGEFQRLRRVKQLAHADLVYPGALHTRFEHLVGTMHVAHRILESLQRREFDNAEHMFNNDEWQAVRIAGLLHDLGHGPFSHVSEDLLDKYQGPARRCAGGTKVQDPRKDNDGHFGKAFSIIRCSRY
jgi:HD superfamily phosphohydrolase